MCALLLGAIAVDTRAFAAEARKFSGRDVAAVHGLLEALRGAPLERPPLPAQPSAPALTEHAEWLRAHALLPDSAGLGGAASLKALSKALLEARFDVRSLSVPDLLALDYKATGLPSGMPGPDSPAPPGGGSSGGASVGVAAIFVPLADLLLRAGGGAALEAQMGAFAAERGVDVLLALTAGDDRKAVRKGRAPGEGEGELTGLKGAALAPALGRGDRPAALAAALAAALESVPAGLPAALLAEPLYAKQGIDAPPGFGLKFERADGARVLLVSGLRRAATRKTVLPAVAHFCKAL